MKARRGPQTERPGTRGPLPTARNTRCWQWVGILQRREVINVARIDYIREKADGVICAQAEVHRAIQDLRTAEESLLDEVMVESVTELLSAPPKVRVDPNHKTITIEVKLDF